MNNRNRRSCRSKRQVHEFVHLDAFRRKQQKLDLHCICSISGQGGWETDIMSFVARDNNA